MRRFASLMSVAALVATSTMALSAAAQPAGDKPKYSDPSYRIRTNDFQVTYEFDPAYKNGPSMDWKGRKVEIFKEKTVKIRIPVSIKKGDVIRGVMVHRRGWDEFAERNNIALIDGKALAPYGGPHKTFLKEAAKVTGHPELEHAGLIFHGVSNVGRFGAHFAYNWPERTIAVILDHSWTPSAPNGGKNYSYGNLPAAEGVPYFFNGSQRDMFQNFDRRMLHFKWATSGFNGSKHPSPKPLTPVSASRKHFRKPPRVPADCACRR